MRRALLVPVLVVTAAGAPLAQRFDTASIKRNTSAEQRSDIQMLPTGEIRLTNVPFRIVVARAYEAENGGKTLNLPAWAESDRYDVIARGKPGASEEERHQMFRALLAERAGLTAHVEVRAQPGYQLVHARADRTLGPGLSPSVLRCDDPSTAPSATRTPGRDLRAEVLEHCRTFYMDKDATLYAGGVELSGLLKILFQATGQPVADKTGLTGFYAVKMRFQLPRRNPATPAQVPGPDAPPSVFTALQEQLGLQLVAGPVDVENVVIDRLERPSVD